LTLGPIRATRMACDQLDVETAYFEAVAAMQQSDLDQGHLYLIGPEGRIMEFARDAGEPCLSCLARQ
jgi:heat shock protein HslJ